MKEGQCGKSLECIACQFFNFFVVFFFVSFIDNFEFVNSVNNWSEDQLKVIIFLTCKTQQ